MPLIPNTRFGSYEIAESIGVGGMGEVFRATDTKLKRDVAIKVLPEFFASDEDRLARFQREAEILASLNHPNIAQIHGLENADDMIALVMELIEGPTLEERIKEGPIPANEALNIAKQITYALEAAHERGIVHRDLKPANIKLKKDGTIKVLDFGIAKEIGTQGISGDNSPMMTTPAMTEMGIIMGTAAYMSPEQARGKFIDERTDIWAFGCVLYEMLTGQLAFGGEDVPETLARIIALDADISTLPGVISPAVRHTIKLCLEKDVRKRVADIRDVRLALEGAFETVFTGTNEIAAVTLPLWRRVLPVAGALLVGGLLIWNLKPEPDLEPQTVNRFAYTIPGDQSFRATGRILMALSPDGQYFVYNTTEGFFLRDMGELEARQIPGTEGGLANPFFSPDGQSLAYYDFSNGQLKRIAISGGAPVVITDLPNNLNGASWGSDNTILFGQPEGIMRVSSNGGTPELVIEAQEGETLASPEFLPGGDTIIFSSDTSNDWDEAQVLAQSLTNGERKILIQGGSDAHYIPTGHLTYALDNGLFAVAFDPETLTISGGPVPLLQQVARAGTTPSAHFAVSENGTAIYISGDRFQVVPPLTFVQIDRRGVEGSLNMANCLCGDPAFSPDGTRLAINVTDTVSGDTDIWIWSFEQETLTRLTFATDSQTAPVWSPDGLKIAYRSSDGIYVRQANGTGTAELLLEGQLFDPFSWSEDGQILYSIGEGNGQEIGLFSVDGESDPEILLAAEFTINRPTLSPNGRWLAYQSDETSVFETYVRPFPDVDNGKWQVSSGGGIEPKWAADGSSLFFYSVEEEALMETRLQDGSAFRNSSPEILFENNNYIINGFARNYTASPDGQSFIVIKIDSSADTSDEETQIIIIQNWTEELKRLVPTD